ALETGKLPEEEFEQRFAAILGVDSPDLIERLMAGSQPDEEMLAAVVRARAAGVRTGLVSNSWGTRRYDRARLAGHDRRARAAARRRAAVRRLAIAAAAAIAAGGCGGAAPPSLIGLRTQANRICSDASRQIGRIATPRSEAGGEAFLR